jgi:glycosyltransferase involved in cell wall biosynthesis
MLADDAPATLDAVAEQLQRAGVRRIHALAWRDLDDPDAGGSEVHADEFERRWASVGFDILHRTSGIGGATVRGERNGYRVLSAGGRMTVFPRAVAAEVLGRHGRFDALVEIWNGVPWFGPVWCRRPRLTFLHHVHGPMWGQILPGPLAWVGRRLEDTVAPPFYRRGLTMTPSSGTRDELLELGFRPDRVVAVENGVDPFFSPGGTRSERPLVLVVARLAPVKRVELVIDAVAAVRATVPDAQLAIVGEGPQRDQLEQQVRLLGATDYVEFLGHLRREELLDVYRRAWVVASGSLAEGWGLALTEGAGCATPSVATDIRGHRSSVRDGETGVLVPPERLADALAAMLTDHDRRARMGAAARRWAEHLTWDRVALEMLRCLRDEVRAG